MIYLPKSRIERRHSKRIIFLLTVFLVGAFFFALFDNLLIRSVSPLWRAENAAVRTLRTGWGFFSGKRALLDENAVLKERLASLELEVSALALLETENERLLALLGRQREAGGITASVLTRPPQSPYDLLVVDAGTRENVAVGARVYLPEGSEIGLVTQAFPDFSRIKLLTTAGEKTQAVLERHGVPVELVGEGGGNFKIILPRETEVAVGDRVLSASLSPTLLAVVEEVTLLPTDSFKAVLARGPANIFGFRFVTIRP